MSWKEFLKPTIGRIILSVVLIILFFFLQIYSSQTFDAPSKTGWPFTFWIHGSTLTPNGAFNTNEFNYGIFAVDLFIWFIITYLISSVIITDKISFLFFSKTKIVISFGITIAVILVIDIFQKSYKLSFITLFWQVVIIFIFVYLIYSFITSIYRNLR